MRLQRIGGKLDYRAAPEMQSEQECIHREFPRLKGDPVIKGGRSIYKPQSISYVGQQPGRKEENSAIHRQLVLRILDLEFM